MRGEQKNEEIKRGGERRDKGWGNYKRDIKTRRKYRCEFRRVQKINDEERRKK